MVIVSLVLLSCRSHRESSPEQALVDRAVQALGGKETLAAVKSLSIKGTVRHWEPEQSFAAGGEPRLTCESAFETVADLGTGASRTDWVRNFTYPAPRTYTFSEIVTPEAGYVAGIDSTARNKQSLESNPPAHSMSGLRLAATLRELRRRSPVLLLDMANHPDRVSPTEEVTVAGVSYPAVDYKVGDQTFIVMFDRSTGLPARIRTLDYDNIWGDVTYDLVLSDWQPADRLPIARSRRYELNGRTVVDVKITEGQLNVPVSAERLSIPATMTASAVKPATGAVPYQWVIRRQFIGTYLDSDQPSYDTRAAAGLHLVELAPGVHEVTGGTHNSLVVEMRDHLVVFDAPVSDAQSNWTLGALKAKFPNQPVKYLVLSHHHMDHAGGLRAFVAAGATLVVGKGDADHFHRVLMAPFRRNPDLTPRDLASTPIVEVADRHVFKDETREVDLYVIDNPHAAGMLLGYVKDARIGWVVDLWSPGRDPLPEKLNPNQLALVNAVKKFGIDPVKFAGGHGSSADYAPLAALEGK
jgi:glyoxylase-like metal-dependent hydrolase (beta-lactamase superfamily II)